jgi:phosphoglycerate dehydrogenase-like enzyme
VDILLVDQLVPEAFAWLEARHSVEFRPDLAGDPAALRKAAYNAKALLLPRKVVVTRELLDFAPLLKTVARMHASADNTDLEACRDRKVRVIQATSSNIRANAEYLLASLLLMYRRGIVSSLINGQNAEIRMGREVNGSVIGIFGLAPTAHTLALMLRGLGAKLIGYDPAVHHTAPIWSQLQIQPVSVKELLENADAITVQVMYASRYQGFINDKMLAYCRPGQVWVGLSRSQLFDPDALARALTDGRISGCMLDGAAPGFAATGTPLHGLKNLFLTPRMGSYTRESRQRASWYVVHRIHETLTAPKGSLDSIFSEPVDLDEAAPAVTPAPTMPPSFIVK